MKSRSRQILRPGSHRPMVGLASISAVVGSVGLVMFLGCGSPETSDVPQSEPTAQDTQSVTPAPEVTRTFDQRLGAVYAPAGDHSSIQIEEITLPELEGGHAIWGSLGRDDAGGIWMGVSVEWADGAYLLQYDPKTGIVHNRGNVIEQLKQAGIYRPSETQMKIHSKIYHADDGYLYFASMDEKGEAEDGSKLPDWGGHLWRISPQSYQWEHLVGTEEPLIAVASNGRYVYALGYFGHVVYKYDPQTGKSNRHEVGSVGAHISRNFMVDERGHVYVPRVYESGEGLRVSLVELDENLKPLHETPLDHYEPTTDFSSHGIVSFTFLKNGSFAFATAPGRLYLVTVPKSASPAGVESLGWFHPDGPSYPTSLFTIEGRRFLVGQASDYGAKDGNGRRWITYDLENRTSEMLPQEAAKPIRNRRLLLYGTHTRDDDGGFYLVGRRHSSSGIHPIAFRVSFP